MEERRRFLKILGGLVLSLGMVPAAEGCSGQGSTAGTGGGSGAGGGGTGGAGSGSSSSSSKASSSASGCVPTTVPAGMPSLYAAAGLYKVPGTKVLIGRDAGGLYALTALCTHNFCNLNTSGTVSAAGVQCKCHGSKFDDLGKVVQGPAQDPLQPFALSLGCDGNLYVDTNTPVDIMVRLKA